METFHMHTLLIFSNTWKEGEASQEEKKPNGIYSKVCSAFVI